MKQTVITHASAHRQFSSEFISWLESEKADAHRRQRKFFTLGLFLMAGTALVLLIGPADVLMGMMKAVAWVAQPR